MVPGLDSAPLAASRRNPGQRVFPMSTKYSFDSKLSPAYELIYIEQCVAIAICSISNVSIDCFLFLLVLHVCGQLTILSRLIERYHESQDENLLELGTRCRCFRCIVENHVRLTRFMNLVESSFNGLILWQFLNNTVLFCVHGYHIVMVGKPTFSPICLMTIIFSQQDVNAQDTISVLLFVTVLIAIAFDFFIYCYVGEAIISKVCIVTIQLFNYCIPLSNALATFVIT
ncbi:uncharacterized protein LOC112493950 isoform X1 [Cephus cinctus]|uniref:Uncharacterized protein LOC112493950 isoform X1 n=1 Tax=Cephus cinctus TaxID=211228 RepID=A0AAJ7VZ13_CEPCN|nr:uncharacterized protein LOC112493950 isoform X1 [Cephus cinctus]